MSGMTVIYSNRHAIPDSPYEYVDLDTLYARADLLVVLAPLTEETRGMINDESIGKMKDGAMVVNVGESASSPMLWPLCLQRSCTRLSMSRASLEDAVDQDDVDVMQLAEPSLIQMRY